MAIRQSWVDLATIVLPARHGSTHAQAVYGRSKEVSSSGQAPRVLLLGATQSPFPPMAIRQSWVGISTIVTSAPLWSTHAQAVYGRSKEVSSSAQALWVL